MTQTRPTRRLILAMAAGAATLAGGLSRAWSADKTSKKEASYQDQPKGKEAKCSECKYFMPPAGCQQVEGTISPEGWCQLFSKRA